MARREKPAVIIKQGAPAWMVSFSDLNTLLLTFFILLIVFAKQKNHELQDRGLGKVKDAFQARGLDGIFSGRLFPVILKFPRPRHKVPPPPSAARAGVERRHDEVDLPPDVSLAGLGEGRRATPLLPPGIFPRNRARLPRELRRELALLVGRLAPDDLVVVQAAASASERDPWRLAGRRAEAVRRALVELELASSRIRCAGRVAAGGEGDRDNPTHRAVSITLLRREDGSPGEGSARRGP